MYVSGKVNESIIIPARNRLGSPRVMHNSDWLACHDESAQCDVTIQSNLDDSSVVNPR